MNAELVSIGTEILLGEIIDTNSAHIARSLRDIGINIYYTTSVGDNLQRITDTLRQGLSRSDLIITTGGLGPTVDDMTRQAVAAATGRDLVLQQHLLDQIAERFRNFGTPMTENNRQQAMIPEGAVILENPVGTAPCFIVESDAGTIISLPGVPREMKYLLQHNVLPYLTKRMGLPAIIKARVLRTTGIGESSLDDLIASFMTQSNPTVGLAAHSGHVDIRITARAASAAEADAMIADTESQIRAVAAPYIFGEEQASLDAAVLGRLRAQGGTLALLEAGTNGVIAARYRESLGAETLLFTEHYPNLSVLRQKYTLPDADLRGLVEGCALALREARGVDVVLAVLAEGNDSALAISTPTFTRGRAVQMANEDLLWAGNWALSYLWRYLQDQEASA